MNISEQVPAAQEGFAVAVSLTAVSALFRRSNQQGERGERGAGAAGPGRRRQRSLRWRRCSKLECWWVRGGFSTWERIRGRRNGRLERAAFSWIRHWEHSEAAQESGRWEGTIASPVVSPAHLDQRSVRPLQVWSWSLHLICRWCLRKALLCQQAPLFLSLVLAFFLW